MLKRSASKGVPGRFFIMKKVQVTITHKVTKMYPNRFKTYLSMTSPFLSVKNRPYTGKKRHLRIRSVTYSLRNFTYFANYSKDAYLNSSGTPIGWLIRFFTLDFVRTAEPLWYTGATTASSSTSFFSALSISSRRAASSV